MELFPDGGFVRLQNRQTGKYVHAEADWEKVTLHPSDGAVPSLNSVWRVQHWVSPHLGENTAFVLLQNAAYGRYLSFSLQKGASGHRGYRVAQLDRNEHHERNAAYAWTWSVERLPAPDSDYVALLFFNCYLRANGRYLTWNTGVTAEPNREPGARISTMMHWRVHGVASSPFYEMPLPLTLEDPDPVGRNAYCLTDLCERFHKSMVHEHTVVIGDTVFPHPPRLIRHVRANDEGEFDQNLNNWGSLVFNDTSLHNLVYELGQLQDDWNGNQWDFTLCMQPGLHGRLMPLVTDQLPRSLDTMNVVVFKRGTPGDEALEYPAQLTPPPRDPAPPPPPRRDPAPPPPPRRDAIRALLQERNFLRR